MHKIRFINYYGKFNTNIFAKSDNSYGYYLSYPGIKLAQILEEQYNYKVVNDESFDTIVFIDLDEELYNYAKKIPANIRKILILAESPIYTPFPHNIKILADNIWTKVISYNREIECPNIYYYDIAITGIQIPICTLFPPQTTIQDIGCNISSYKNDTRGYTKDRDTLLLELLDKDMLHQFGRGWAKHKNYKGISNNKIFDIARYKYYFAIENSKYSGYVTEKIADSILAERPCIYFGDLENAQRRFPNTFVPLEELNINSFLKAREKLFDNYDYYYANVLKEKQNSIHWCDSFLENMLKAITI